MSDAQVTLAVALFGAPLLLMLATILRVDTLSWAVRAGLWVIAAAAVCLVADASGGVGAALQRIGLGAPTTQSAVEGAFGILALLITAALVFAMQRFANLPIGDREAFQRVARLPIAQRSFIVLTAAVVEEVLYRGVAITTGSAVFGKPLYAAAVATVVFTLAHFRWRASHLLQVFGASAVLSGLFLETGDLWACIFAHFVADLGVIVAPVVMRRNV